MTLLKELCPVLLGGGKKFWDVLSTFQIGTFTFFCPRIALSSSVGNIFSTAESSLTFKNDLYKSRENAGA